MGWEVSFPEVRDEKERERGRLSAGGIKVTGGGGGGGGGDLRGRKSGTDNIDDCRFKEGRMAHEAQTHTHTQNLLGHFLLPGKNLVHTTRPAVKTMIKLSQNTKENIIL